MICSPSIDAEQAHTGETQGSGARDPPGELLSGRLALTQPAAWLVSAGAEPFCTCKLKLVSISLIDLEARRRRARPSSLCCASVRACVCVCVCGAPNYYCSGLPLHVASRSHVAHSRCLSPRVDLLASRRQVSRVNRHRRRAQEQTDRQELRAGCGNTG